MKLNKICFISFNSYPLFENKSTKYFGGAELQISLIVKELSKDRQFDVNLIVGDFGQKQVIKKGRIKIYKAFEKNCFNLRGVFNFINLLRRIEADIYVERTMNPKVGLVALFCRLSKKKFIYMLAHDWDCKTDHYLYLGRFGRLLFNYGIKQADLIIAQTKTQQKKLKSNFGLKSQVMPSVAQNCRLRKNTQRKFVLWVGRADYWKQPIKLIELAKALPHENFVMICRKGMDSNLFNQVKNLAEKQKNIKFFSAVPIEEILSYFARAKVLVNTSLAEGFSNTFIQAGSALTPVLSLIVNPDDYINRFKCGRVVNNNHDQLIKQCRIILKNQKLAEKMGKNHYEYMRKHHSLENINIFKQTICEKLLE